MILLKTCTLANKYVQNTLNLSYIAIEKEDFSGFFMVQQLRIVMAQLNLWVGNLDANSAKICSALLQARNEYDADIIAFPELALSGYPPEDLLIRKDFQKQIQANLEIITSHTQGIMAIVGFPQMTQQGIYNAAAILQNGKWLTTYHKQCLPNYGVFDEKRYFITGHSPCLVNYKGIRLAIMICEDLWYPEPIQQAKQAGAELVISINASPYDMHKANMREEMLHQRIKESALPILYIHGVGGQDELVFDGGSLALDATGKLCAHAGHFKESLFPIDVQASQPLQFKSSAIAKPLSFEASAYQALVLSVKDYVLKNNFSGVILGLSGGIDSALTLAIAVDALGAEQVDAYMLPSRYTSSMSLRDAKQQAQWLNVAYHEISIEPSYNSLLQSLSNHFQGLPPDITEENLQARCRGVILMALANKFNKLVLTTGNKSEIAVGYTTLYGDMAGGFDVLKDVWKTLVFRLAKYRNTISEVIPRNIIERAPSAELAHQQTDQDFLPPYAILDEILELFVEKDLSFAEIVAKGFDAPTVRKVIQLVKRNEYKRRQAPLGPKITTRAFGRDRRYPISSGFDYFK